MKVELSFNHQMFKFKEEELINLNLNILNEIVNNKFLKLEK